MTFSETARQVVHMAVGLGVVLLGWLSWPQAAACAALAALVNRFVLPRLAGALLFRPGEAVGDTPSGIVLYPLSVLALLLVFRERVDLAGAAWAILAFGDGAATLVGRAAGGSGGRWPWNPAKSYVGSLAFLVVGATTAVGAALWLGRTLDAPPPLWFAILAPVAATLVAMFAETIPVRLDDNVTVPAAAAMTLAACAAVDPAVAVMAVEPMLGRLPAAILVNATAAAVSWRAGAVSASGVIAGLAVGLVIYVCAGAGAWTMLLAGFVVAAVTSRVGLSRKRMLGIDQERGGRRGATHVFANCGVAAVAAGLVATGGAPATASVALVAGLVAGASDTAASEVGKAWGRTTWSILGWARVPPGTIGAMSVEGTATGVVTAGALAALAVALGVVSVTALWIIVVATCLAMVVESVLGATLEPRGVLNNDLLNFLQTALAAAAAAAAWHLLTR